MLINDRQITISAAGSRKAAYWPAQRLYWSELVEKLRTPARGTETLAEYLNYPKSKQDELKDVGGFVAGTLKDNRRKANNVLTRDVITLDLDNIQPGGTQEVLRRIEALGCAYAVYSTRKHEEAKPRLRVLVPFSRSVTSDEYEPIARKLAQIIGMELCDPTTFEASRLMYWPSCCSDSTYVYYYGDKFFLDADGMLLMYKDWRNVLEWPEVPGGQQTHVKLAAKQGNPVEKTGVIGAFCRTYDVYKAMEVFLPGVYIPCDDASGRFTFSGGSTTGGAVIYENGNFLYSHHSTDPAGGRLCNAFDLVRLHKFSALDDEAKIDTPINKLPSYTAMCELAVNDASVSAVLNKERYEKATEDFALAPEEVNQIWAEAYLYWQLGETLYLAGEAEVQSKLEQEAHSESNAKDGIIREFVNRPIPQNWDKRSLSERRLYWTSEYGKDKVDTVERDRICAAEVWCEGLGGDLKYMRRADAVEINCVLAGMTGWKRHESNFRVGCYGTQKGYIKMSTYSVN